MKTSTKKPVAKKTVKKKPAQKTYWIYAYQCEHLINLTSHLTEIFRMGEKDGLKLNETNFLKLLRWTSEIQGLATKNYISQEYN